MKCGVRVALGVAGGYFLGRTKKMKLGLMLAGMAAGRQAGGPAALLGQGKDLLNASPELARLSDVLTGRLLDAGKGAALTVATHQVESLTARLQGRVEHSLGNVGGGERPPKDTPEVAGDEVDEVEEDYESDDEESADESPDEESPDVDAPDVDAPDVDADKEPVAVGARSDPDEDAQSDAAPNRSAGRAGGTARASKGAGRTAVPRTAGAASGGRRMNDKAVGRPSRAKRRDDNG
jgi:hypothetical protein